MDPQKRTGRSEGLSTKADIQKPDDKTRTNLTLETVQVTVAPKVAATSDEKKPPDGQKRNETTAAMEDLGGRALPAGFYLLPLLPLALAVWALLRCSWADLALAGVLLPGFLVHRHMCVELGLPGLPNRQPSFLTSKVKKYRLDVVFPLATTTILLWRLSLPLGRAWAGVGVAGYTAKTVWFRLNGLPHRLIGCLGAVVTGHAVFLLLSSFWIRTPVGIFLVSQFFIKQSNRLTLGRMWAGATWSQHEGPVPDTSELPAVYFLYVLGSGGHTAEMIEIIKKQFQGKPNQHRRYVITSGDKDSRNHVARLENLINNAYPTGRAGTWDTFTIPRARKVHQSLLTAPFTCLVTAIQALLALSIHPNARPAKHYGDQFKWPHVVVTNGPATGFIVCLVAHVLKMFYLVPENCLKMVYIESWARTRSLSLTGKLFLWTGIADVFCVQHERLAQKTGAEYIGLVKAKPMPFG
ncbi:oligosaccharide biosynthesis protein Alg14 like-domain-containing protein [Cladorrhinum sp. PSN332]|nr:oligosaccharide biosynthesis protein Alg14 like-domain-containing protein [Cladorrhinum sp. PSN332]